MGGLMSLLGGAFLSTVVPIAVLVTIAMSVVRAVRGTTVSPHLVVTDWRVADSSGSGEQGGSVHVQGRVQGFMSWLMTLLRITPIYKLSVDRLSASYESNSLAGYTKLTVPMRKVNRIIHGVSRPWWMALLVGGLVLAVMASVFTAIGAEVFTHQTTREELTWFGRKEVPATEMYSWVPFAALVLALPFGIGGGYLYYLLNTVRTIGLGWSGKDSGVVLRFKRSVIEGVSLDDAALARLAKAIQALVDSYGGRGLSSPEATPPAAIGPTALPDADTSSTAVPPQPVSAKAGRAAGTMTCTRCGRQYAPDDARRFCDECGGALASG